MNICNMHAYKSTEQRRCWCALGDLNVVLCCERCVVGLWLVDVVRLDRSWSRRQSYNLVTFSYYAAWCWSVYLELNIGERDARKVFQIKFYDEINGMDQHSADARQNNEISCIKGGRKERTSQGPRSKEVGG